jgi:hypothetical protein
MTAPQSPAPIPAADPASPPAAAQPALTDDHAQALLADALQIADAQNAPTGAPKANPWEDPKAAQAEIERLRKENGAARTNAKAQAADEARNELAQTIGKALGLVKDEPVDPAKLTEQLLSAQTGTKQAQIELAVFRASGAVNGDPSALLDSRAFLAKLADIDPADSAAVAAAITAAVAENPRLGVQAGPRVPAPNPAQGSSANGSGTDLDAQIDAATKSGQFQRAIALKQQRAALKKS